MEKTTLNRPFLKWAGGKTRLVPRIKKLLPKGQRLIEPFAGSAALFLNTNFERYLIADINHDLIRLYQAIQSQGDTFIKKARSFFTKKYNQEDIYYQLREKFNASKNTNTRAALFLYLNRHCYNGLCRYNNKGEFNVPFGRYSKPYFPEQELYYFHEKSQCAEFVCQTFTDTMRQAQNNDVIYCDPPYVPLSETASFTDYSANSFGAEEQLLLAQLTKEIAHTQLPILISNHALPFTKEIYSEAIIHQFRVRRLISCKGKQRKKVKELLAFFS